MKQKFTMPDGEIAEKDFPIFKTPYNHDTNFESDRTALFCNDPSRTKQEFKEEVDINNIIKRALASGEPPPMPVPEHFMDVTSRLTYFEMQTRMAEATANFYRLPADIRTAHNNSPETWADAVITAVEKKDGDAVLKLGLSLDIRPPEEAAKTPTPSGGSPAPEPAKGASDAPKGP